MGWCNASYIRPLVYVPVFARLVVLQLVLNHADNNVVTDKTTGIHNLLRLNAELGLLRDLVAEQVASGQMADAKLVPDPRGLSTFAYIAPRVQHLGRRAHSSLRVLTRTRRTN